MENKKSVFEVLNAVNCNEHTEKKNGLTYLSWAWAWAEVKKRYPSATYTIYENKDGLLYHTDGKTAWVKTGVTIEGIELIEYLPVMDYNNKSIPLERITSFDVNKAIQRSLTKACARHGLGLYIYAGEDLPEVGDAPAEQPKKGVRKVKTLVGETTTIPSDGAVAPNNNDDDNIDLGLFKQLLKEAKTVRDKGKVWDDWKEAQDYIKGKIKKADTKEGLTEIWEAWPEAQLFIKPLLSERRKQLGF